MTSRFSFARIVNNLRRNNHPFTICDINKLKDSLKKIIEFFHIFFLLLSISTNIIYESRIVLDSISGQRFTFSSNHVSSNLINKPNEWLKRLTYCSTVSIYRASIPSNIVNINLSQIFGRSPPLALEN